ncbi:MAG: NACHT domain-containing protein [Bacteroidetes bacterium]|nr:NACHT domain-containing protein [Bacteroidota bacterium]
MNIIENYIIKKVLDTSWNLLSKRVKRSKYKLKNNKDDLEDSLNYHMKSINNFCTSINFKRSNIIKKLSDLYIDVDILLNPHHLSADNYDSSISSSELIKSINTNLIIFGQAGAGKTTLLKKICSNLLFDTENVSKNFNFPILIELNTLEDFYSPLTKYYTTAGPLTEKLLDITGLRIDFIDEDIEGNEKTTKTVNANSFRTFKERCIVELLDNISPIILLDGFDEIFDYDLRDRLIKDIIKLTKHFESTKVLLTTRVGEFNYYLDNTLQYEISHLTSFQVKTFVHNWFNNDKNLSNKFLEKLYESPFKDTSIKPLTIAHLCVVFKKYKSFPDKPSDLYKRIVNLLIEDWDYERNITRKSQFPGFLNEEKFRFLCHLSYHLSTNYYSLEYTHDEFLSSYLLIHDYFNLPKSASKKVVNEIESHTSLFVQSSEYKFKFSHKSIQEYLVAEYIKSATRSLEYLSLWKLPYEIAIAICLSMNNLHSFYEQTILILYKCDFTFLIKFLQRLYEEKPVFVINNDHEKKLLITSLINIISSFWYSRLSGLNIIKDIKNYTPDDLLFSTFKRLNQSTQKWNIDDEHKIKEIEVLLKKIIKQSSKDFAPVLNIRLEIVNRVTLNDGRILNLFMNISPGTNLKSNRKYLIAENNFLTEHCKISVE